MTAAALVSAFRARLGENHVLTDESGMAPYLTDWRGRYQGKALAVLRPDTVENLAAVVSRCYAEGVAMVPQGGNTGLCGGATPDGSGRGVVISLARMNRVREVDVANGHLTAEAGCTLAAVQEAAAERDRLFPLSLASEGSCQMGGVLSTNAGGVQVLRYGSMRDLALGLEVVLPDGQVWSGLRGLRKDNTGYDLKQCFIGAEGTLGFITAATVRLFARPRAKATAWLAVTDVASAVALLGSAQSQFDARLTAFELISDAVLELVVRHMGQKRPLAMSPWYVLLELTDVDAAMPLADQLSGWLAEALEAGWVVDAAVAQSEAQGKQLWALREQASEAQKREGYSIKHDISLPVSAIPAFLTQMADDLPACYPGLRIVCFGHLGDGNLHFNLSLSDPEGNAALLAAQETIHQRVHSALLARGGSISAEHGIGQLKRAALVMAKSGIELDLMHRIKMAFDPKGLMNPGKVL